MPEITKLEEKIGAYTNIKKINCDSNPDICGKLEIRGIMVFYIGYPTIIHYAPVLNNPGSYVSKIYNHERNAEGIRKFVEENFKSPLMRIVTGKKLSRFDVAYQEFMDKEKEKLHCVYFAENEVTPPLFLMSFCSKFAKNVVMAFSGESKAYVLSQLKYKLRGRGFVCIKDDNVKSCDGLGYLRLENFLNDELVEYNKKSEL